MIASMIVEEPTDGDKFLAYVEQVLCPALEARHVVMLDNLPSPRVKGVHELVEAMGTSLLYCRPTRPISTRTPNQLDCWVGTRSKRGRATLKQLVRSAKARSRETLDQAIAMLLPQTNA